MKINDMTADQRKHLCEVSARLLDDLELLKKMPMGFVLQIAVSLVLSALRSAQEKICK
jgi:hypothetical protein